MIARAFLALAVVLGAARAQAQAVAVVIDGCEEEIVPVLQVELRDEVAFSLEGEALQVSNACSAVVEIRFRGAVRKVELDGVERGLWGRVVAIAAAELVRELGPAGTSEAGSETAREEDGDRNTERGDDPTGEDAVEPDPEQDLPPEPAQARPLSTAPARAERWMMAIGPSLQLYALDGTALYGADAALDWRALSTGVTGTFGSTGDSLGTANYRRLQAFATITLLAAELGNWRFTVGPRGAAGATFGVASPARSATSTNAVDATGEVGLEGTVALGLGTDWLARLRTGAGYAFGPRYLAGSRALADLSGPYLSASLHIGLALASGR